ncbi:Uncharacterized protein APZ42_018081 [Daphnia magna]|uniref:Uncharacterized protein n=1 Tax=Daphnia magna TaxID=35525 RepID=A0A164ZCV0_9CRUS|nr:Uncharacterized protein APZ42_018081 [Daphnia magna]
MGVIIIVAEDMDMVVTDTATAATTDTITVERANHFILSINFDKKTNCWNHTHEFASHGHMPTSNLSNYFTGYSSSKRNFFC